MLPLLPFAAGIVAGALGIQALKKTKPTEHLGSLGASAKSGLDKAGTGLRDATVSGLSALERSSASLRTRLSSEDKAPSDEGVDAVAAAPVADPEPEEPAKAPKAKKAAPRRKAAPRKKTAASTAKAKPVAAATPEAPAASPDDAAKSED